MLGRSPHYRQSNAFSFHGRVDVVICLSTTVRNDTLQEAKEHRVSLKCRKQLRVEELEMVMPPGATVLVLSLPPGATVLVLSQLQSSIM